MIWKVAIAAALMATPVTVAAQEAATDAASAPATAKKNDDRKICKSSNEIGSRLRKKKTCMTTREWADLSQQTQEETRDIQRVGIKSN